MVMKSILNSRSRIKESGVMHQASLAEGFVKSQGDEAMPVIPISITSDASHDHVNGAQHRNARFMIIITRPPSDADAVLGCHFENLLFQNHLKPVVITSGNPGSSGGFLLYKSYTFDGIWLQRASAPLTATTLRLHNRRLVHTGPIPMENRTTESAVRYGRQSPERSSSELWHV